MNQFYFWTNRFFFRTCFLLITICCCYFSSNAQVQVQLTMLSGAVTTTCTDGVFGGEPADVAWEITVENEPAITYANENCPNFPDLPNVQYDNTLACLSDLRGGEIQLCFRVFDKEAPVATPCDATSRACEEVACANFLLPIPGTDSTYTYSLPAGLASGGTFTFSISTSADNAVTTNDRICHAINLGTLNPGTIIGNANQGQYNNYCAAAISEPNPSDGGLGWQNQVATWFSFTTSANPHAIILIEAVSDPEEMGDPVNLQLALYETADGTCGSPLTLVKQNYDGDNLNEFLTADCLNPNQQYFIMVDGEVTTPDFLRGIYGIQVSEVAVFDGFSDEICDAIPLEVKEGGTVYSSFYNNCATNVGDPTITNFTSNNSVWFEFRPGASRRVGILVESDPIYPAGIDPIDIEVALFSSPSNSCTGTLVEVESQYETEDGKSEFFDLECLNTKQTYWLLVDGSDTDPTGIFHIVIADRSFPDPVSLDTIICEGMVLELGNKTYANAGVYLDTIITDDGCLEILETNLRVAPPLMTRLNQQRISSGMGQADGVQIIAPSGGTGNYTIEWSDGQSNQVATNLIGGEEYCVTVTDVSGCVLEECFIMEFIVPIDALINNDTVRCANNTDGQISILVANGQAPYEFTIRGIDDPSVIEIGVINKNDSTFVISKLPVGTYNVALRNEFTANNYFASIEAPLPLEVSLVNQENNRCFGDCNGFFEINAVGGTGEYQFAWDNGLPAIARPESLCAGDYFVTVTDANNCSDSLRLSITESEEIQVTARQVEPVTCFGQSNGQAILEASVPLSTFFWDNGEFTEKAVNLDAGIHEVTVSDENFCESIITVEITQPTTPLEAKINLINPITCGGEDNGVLADASFGGNNNYQYNWSTGSNQSTIENLVPGEYALTVTDEKGCQHFTSIELFAPTPIEAIVTVKDVNCPEGKNSGGITVESVTGGITPYLFSIDGIRFSDNSLITGLNAGTYDLIVQDANDCEAVYPQTIGSPPEVSVFLGEDRVVKLGDVLRLEAMTKQVVEYEWSSSDSLDCMDCANVNAQPIRDAVYAVKVTDPNTGCTAEDALKISVLKERNIFFPTAFSPNGDGTNDELLVFAGNEVERILTYKIFSRSGSLIFEANNFKANDFANSWDGTYNGQLLNSAVFVYFAEVQFIDGERLVFSGDLTLMR